MMQVGPLERFIGLIVLSVCGAIMLVEMIKATIGAMP